MITLLVLLFSTSLTFPTHIQCSHCSVKFPISHIRVNSNIHISHDTQESPNKLAAALRKILMDDPAMTLI